MHEDVATIHEQQRAIGYTSDLVEGEDECRVYMESIFSDWQAKNVSVVLHEKKGGYAESMPSMLGLRAKGAGARRRRHRAGDRDGVRARRRRGRRRS